MVSSKRFSENPKKAACVFKCRTKKDRSQKKCFNYSITLLQQSSDKRDAHFFDIMFTKAASRSFRYNKKELFI